jgi:hypothetical protein
MPEKRKISHEYYLNNLNYITEHFINIMYILKYNYEASPLYHINSKK